MPPKQPAVYIMTNRRNGTLYTGVTAFLRLRVWRHRNSLEEGFTKRYGLTRLAYYEFHPDLPAAIRREKLVKRWYRAWRLKLIEDFNPNWDDLWDSIQ